MPRLRPDPQEQIANAIARAKPWAYTTPPFASISEYGEGFVPGFAEKATFDRMYGEETRLGQIYFEELWGKKGGILESKGFQKRLGRYAREREGFLGRISPLSYNDELFGDRGPLNPKLWEVAGNVGAESGTADYNAMRVKPLHSAGIERNVSQGTLARHMARWEIDPVNQLASHGRQPVNIAVGDIPMGSPALSGNKIYQTSAQQMDWANKMFGQEKYFKDVVTGKMVRLGSRNVTGIVKPMEELKSIRDFAADLSGISKMKPVDALANLRDKYFQWMETDDPTLRRMAEMWEPKLEKAAGKNVFRRDWKLMEGNKRYEKVAKNIEALQKAMAEQSNRLLAETATTKIEPTLIKGYTAQRELLKDLEEGARVQMTGDKIVEISKAEKLSQITAISQETGKPVNLGRLSKEYVSSLGREYLSPDTFPVQLVRKPGYYGQGAKRYLDEWATAVTTPSGDQIAWINKQFAKEFSEDVASGVLKEKLHARIYKDWAKGGQLEVGLFTTPGGLKKYGGYARGKTPRWAAPPLEELSAKMRAVGVFAPEKQAILRNMVEGRGLEGYLKTTDLTTKYPTSHIRRIINIKKSIGKPPSKAAYMIAGAAIVGGALLAYNATRTRRQRPLDEGDIPRSMYGDTSREPMLDSMPTRQPAARIMQNNRPGSYTTNIDLESMDSNNVMDYKQLANTMSSISRSALGTNKISTELHITDDSRSMDSHQIQRQFASYLRR